MNENLRRAMLRARLSEEDVAVELQVDPKTVQRWVAGATVPYQRNQATVAQALGLEPHDLWPDTITTSPGQPARPGPADPGSPLGDVVGSWGHAYDPGAPDVAAIVSQAERRVDVRHDSRARLTQSTIIPCAIGASIVGPGKLSPKLHMRVGGRSRCTLTLTSRMASR